MSEPKEVLRAWLYGEMEPSPEEPKPTPIPPLCPQLAELMNTRSGHWTEEQQLHALGCRWCKFLLKTPEYSTKKGDLGPRELFFQTVEDLNLPEDAPSDGFFDDQGFLHLTLTTPPPVGLARVVLTVVNASGEATVFETRRTLVPGEPIRIGQPNNIVESAQLAGKRLPADSVVLEPLR